MASGSSPLPFGLDPLIAEAKRRMKRRRALVLVLALAIAGAAVGIALAVRGPSTSPFGVQLGRPTKPRGENIGSGPFVLFGAVLNINGFKGDLQPPRKQASLGCLDGRRVTDAFAIQNRSHVPVTLLSAPGRSSTTGIFERVATQFALSPPYHPVMGSQVDVGPVFPHDWSAAPTRPRTIPPGRIATVQSNFVFRHCGRLSGGRSVSVPRSLALRYRASGRVREKLVPLSSLAFALVAGPTRRTCAVPGSISAVSSDTPCTATRRAALACHPLSHGSWGDCTSAHVLWDCGRYAHELETCWQGPQRLRAHWFRVRWNPPT